MPTDIGLHHRPRIPCRYKDGTAVSPIEADMIMRAFGFSSAREAEQLIAAGEQRRRERRTSARAAA